MKLSDWLTNTNTKITWFAEQIGVDPITVGRYLAGVRRPDWKVLPAITRVTGGCVTANDFVELTPKQKPTAKRTSVKRTRASSSASPA